jgi:cyclase
MGIEKIKGRIYANVDYEFANVACINTTQGLVLVDTPTLPRDITHWKEFISGLEPNRIAYNISTHHHFDHIIGNNQLGGTVIMHEEASAEMLKEGGTLRESFIPVYPGLTREEIDFVLTEPLITPEITFSDMLSLHMGDVTLRLLHLGGHSSDSICVYVEEERVLLTGDNVTAGRHPYKGEGNFTEWMKSLRWMKGLEIDFIIPGHGEVCQKSELDHLTEYFSRLWYITEDLIKRGMGRDEVIKEVNRLMFNYYEIEPERLEGAKIMFDLGTVRLYDEILDQI